jgi:Txe/YoeB family toxin of Txe-Axe toxin-antitoxin module
MNYIQKKIEQLIKKLQKENDLETANKIEINSYRIIDYYSQKIENTNQEIGSY